MFNKILPSCASAVLSSSIPPAAQCFVVSPLTFQTGTDGVITNVLSIGISSCSVGFVGIAPRLTVLAA